MPALRPFVRAALGGVLTAVVSLPLAAQEAGIAVGSRAPDAAVTTLDGKPARLSQFIGKTPVVLEFWATWCSNCKALEPSLAQAVQALGTQVRFVAVAVSANQSPQRVQAYMAKHRLPVTMLYDATGAATDAYDVPTTSYVVVIDRAGTVVYTGSGGGQDLVAAARKGVAGR
ncbi:MAG: TlpA family protein disulfide reductase [Gemmatimonadaceae bacterium]|jgi:peroxiredoxin|nr:TlpA family protein disulfide reductase [Gemmatimonadaceae bacterium]